MPVWETGWFSFDWKLEAFLGACILRWSKADLTRVDLREKMQKTSSTLQFATIAAITMQVRFQADRIRHRLSQAEIARFCSLKSDQDLSRREKELKFLRRRKANWLHYSTSNMSDDWRLGESEQRVLPLLPSDRLPDTQSPIPHHLLSRFYFCRAHRDWRRRIFEHTLRKRLSTMNNATDCKSPLKHPS